jgi:hypothetical protein
MIRTIFFIDDIEFRLIPVESTGWSPRPNLVGGGHFVKQVAVGAGVSGNSHFGRRAWFDVHALACFRGNDIVKGGHQTLRTRQNEHCCGVPAGAGLSCRGLTFSGKSPDYATRLGF